MKQIITLLILTISLSVNAEEKANNNDDDAAVKLASSIGLEKLLDATMTQTRKSLEEQTDSMIQQITKGLPKLSAEQYKELKNILNEYTNSVLNSLDTKKASLIYTTTLSNRLTPKEIKEATDYYNSPEGQNLLISVSEASTELNKYFFTQMRTASEKSISTMMKKLQLLRTKISSKAEVSPQKGDQKQ